MTNRQIALLAANIFYTGKGEQISSKYVLQDAADYLKWLRKSKAKTDPADSEI